MPAIADQRGVRISPRKVGEVAALVRGRSVADAVVILENTPRRAAKPVMEAVKSANANAIHNHNYKPDTTFIAAISVQGGTRLKRFRPAARGRALRFQRQTSHIQVVIEGVQREVKKPAAKADTKEKK